MTPYYDLIRHLTPAENLQFRIDCRERALVDRRFRDAMIQACFDDLLFFMAFACWSFEPRAKQKIRPFVPWVHQEPVFVAMDEAVDRAEAEEVAIDVILDKSRAQGGTFGYLWIDLRRWLRDRMFAAGYVTRNENLVDSKTDSNTVLWKIGWAIDLLPFWLAPAKWERHLGQHTFTNYDNGALLAGYAAGQDVAAGGRATVFTCDEFGAKDFIAGGKDEAVMEALHDVTNCLTGGTLVVTNEGLAPIEAVELFHRVWDGTMWVSHDGSIYRGEQETISAHGIRLTPDHQVLTTGGWKDASVKGHDREEVRLPDGYQEEWIDQVPQAKVAVPVSMRETDNGVRELPTAKKDQKLWLPEGGNKQKAAYHSRQVGDSDTLCVDRHDSALCQPKESALSRLRRPWDFCVQAVAKVREFLGGHGRASRGEVTGAVQQRVGLPPGKLLLGNVSTTGGQQAEQRHDGDIVRQVDSCAASEGCRHTIRKDSSENQTGLDGGRPPEAVYDLLNCGPRQAFTVIDGNGRPLLIHNCLRMVSARYADAGVFHEACQNPDSAKNGVYLILDWKDNPIHGKNSYVVVDGKPIAQKPEEQEAVDAYHVKTPDLRARLERKGFKFEGVVRSPWYDMRCLRPTSTPRLIASQLDRNPRGAVGKAFTIDLLDRMKREKCKLPVWQGQPVFDSETLKLKGLIPRDDGLLKLWFRPGIDNTPPLGPFTVGCDMAVGSDGAYSSNSVASGLDDRTGEQVLEYSVKGMPLIKFARVAVGLSMWLRNALLGWEDSGMSRPFAKEVMEVIYYGNVFFRDVPELGSRRKSRKPGWPCRDDEDKAEMFEKMALAMEIGQYTPRSEEMIVECGEYEWDKGKIIHAPTKNRGAVEKNHGDRAIAGGGCWLVFSTDNAADSIDTSEETGETPEYGSFLWREQRERRRAKSGSPEFGIRDVVRY